MRKILLVLSAAPTALCVNYVAHAQENGDVPVESQHVDLDQIIVTGSPIGRRLGETLSGTTVLTGEELAEELGSSLGETLRNQPGITSSFFGAGASRPIIRGLGGDRVRVLEDGIGSFDAAQTSPDHAVPIEPALAERIEIFRGPSSLLYGSSASGGVVNTVTGKIPEAAPEDGFDGAVRYGYSTAANANETAAGFNAAAGNFVLHGEGFYRDAGNYEIDGLNGSQVLIDALEAAAAEQGETFDPDERFEDGFVPNSDLETYGGAGGFSYLFDNGSYDGFFGASFSILDSNYGLPEGILTAEDLEGEEEEGEEGEEEGEEAGIRIDLEILRYDVKGEINGDLGPFEKLRLRAGYGDYRHFELEGDEIGTAFENDEVEGRLELVGKPFNFASGEVRTAVGVQGRYRDFSAVGAEAFVPPSEQTQIGVFGLSELRRGNLLFDLAARYEYVENETGSFIDDEDAIPVAVSNTFDAISVSGGVGWQATENVFLGLSAFRTERAPSLEEQFSFGPHLATQSFEVGDAELGEETARGVELTLRGEAGPFTAVINGFYTNYDDFIFEQETGGILDGLPVFAFVAADTEFRGFEIEVDADLATIDTFVGPMRLAARGQADYVRATSSGLLDQDQPRIPPLSTLFGLSATSDLVSLKGEVEYVTAQDNIAAFELPTDSYVFVNAFIAVRPFEANRGITFEVRARNLNDAEGRVHSSFLKDTTPLPGRDIRFAVRAAF